VFSFCQCSNATKARQDDNCKQIGEKIGILLFDYKVYRDTTYARLDTALNLIDSIFCNCPKYYVGLSTSKLKILCFEKRYSEAIDYIKSLDDIKLRPLLKKSILLNRFYAMQSQYKGDTISRNKFIKGIVVELRDTFSNVKIDSILQLPNDLDIIRSGKGFTLMQYYYYRAQIEGVNKISNELDSFQKRINGNPKFFNRLLKKPLEDDFMEFNGI
jgi:hypothetical protein